MTKSATDVMQEIVFAAVVDGLVALKTASKGVPNALLRDINAVHTNATFADLPQDLQTAISASVRAAFTKLLKEGYSVTPAGEIRRPSGPPRGPGDPQRRPRPPSGGADRPRGPRRPGGDRPNAPGDPVRRGGRPPKKPRP